MTDVSDEERDSRTAAIGTNQPRANGSGESSRQSSGSRRPEKQPLGQDESSDSVTQDIRLSAADLGFASDSASAEDTDDETSQSGMVLGAAVHTSKPQGPVNWNTGSKSTIRTSLGARKTLPSDNAPTTAFDAVNNKFWRSRSASESSYDPEEHVQISEPVLGKSKADETRGSDTENLEETQTHGSPHFVDETDESESGEISEGDDAIMLNLGAHHLATSKLDTRETQQLENLENVSHAAPDLMNPNGAGDDSETLNASASKPNLPFGSKEDAFRLFCERYSTPPAILADLLITDLNTHLRCFSHDQNINKLDLTQPVMCTECWQQGHLNLVCPTRECEHCGAWNLHESRFCPTWRRCQRCRERGHDESRCNSKLRASAAENPCDLCGSNFHTEWDCDAIWKFPHLGPPSGPISVSVSCSYCTSRHHLVGDCPSLSRPLSSSTWTLSGCDPALVTNLNFINHPRPLNDGTVGMQIRGRSDHRPVSPESDGDDMFDHRARRGSTRNKKATGRGDIRIGSGIGKDRNLMGSTNQRGPASYDPRQAYRDRQDILGSHTRQRSFSPDLRPGHPRDPRPKESWNPGRPPQAPRRGRGGPVSRGRGGRQASSTETYRPMPSAGKKAWNKFRL